MKAIQAIIILTTISFGLFAQEFEVPKDYKFQTAKDYDYYEGDIIKCFDWLMKTPVNEQTDKQRDANAFLVAWISGSPKVKIVIKEEIVTFMDENSPSLLFIFMGGWSKYSLESKQFDNKVEGNFRGVESVIEFYTRNKGNIPRSKAVEKYIKMKEKGELRAFIEKNA